MTLREKQSVFARMAALLILEAYRLGYEVTLGDAHRDRRCPYGNKRSLHHKRLAIDLNLFRDGKYLRRTEDYELLGLYWESVGGSWGGRFGEKRDATGKIVKRGWDGNHFEYKEIS